MGKYTILLEKQSIGFQWNDMGFHMVNDMFFCFSVFFSNPVARIFDGLFFFGDSKQVPFWNVFFWCPECFFARNTIHRSIRYGGQCNLRFDDTNPDTDAWRTICCAGR